jgi:uncharacterized protein (DUF1501 family)
MDESLDRRAFLRWSALGAGFGGVLRAEAGRARSCIWIWQRGGASHLDTFDPKPGAPLEIRGEFRAIGTSVPGIRISEHLPRTARQMHRLTIVRSMCARETNHERALHYLETGASLGPGPVVVRDEAASADAPLLRECRDAVRRVEAGARFVHVGRRRTLYDTHVDNFRTLRERVLPEFDRAFPSLLEDLEARGLLAGTLVVVCGEFGRTPRINAEGGRDHHAGAFAAVLAGAGVPGGRVLGATDSTGTEVVDLPVSPADLLRTVHGILGTEPVPQHLAANGRLVNELFA